VRCCHRNGDIQTLQQIVPSRLSPDSTSPQVRLNPLTRQNVPLLCIASACGSLEAVKILVRAGATIDRADSLKYTAVHWAAFSGHADVLSFLLDNGGKPIIYQTGEPLLLATRYGRIECVNVLLAAGANVSCTDVAGRTPLHLASWFGHVEIASALLAAGAAPDAQDGQLRTPLHCCCWFGLAGVVVPLLEKHAPLNATDKAQDTPLHLACKHKRVDIVKMLLEAGADPKLPNLTGETAEKIAEVGADRQILQLFEQRETATPMLSWLDTKEMALLLRDHRAMTKTLETIASTQEAQTKSVSQMKATLDQQWADLQQLALEYQRLREQIQELEAAAVRMRDMLRARAAKNRFSLKRVPS
jgi:ankyrin repeat protein